MTASPGQQDRYAWLDLVRGLAALEVAATHLKYFLLAGIDARSNFFWKSFNVITGQGHNAVMIFFVLSGYLVGKQVFGQFSQGRWSWAGYAIRRLSRLWMVLIPALLLTALWDYLGLHALHGSLYLGQLDLQKYGSLPNRIDIGSIHETTTFIGNLFFLQNGILVGSFGINGPLWSLANEFWYYVIFPLAFYAVSSNGRPLGRVVCAALTISLCLILPFGIILYGVIWLFGFFVVILEQNASEWRKRHINSFIIIFSAIILLSLMYIGTRFMENMISDFMIGGAFSITLFFILNLEMKNIALRRGGSFVAEFSYTLYLTHFPFLAFILCALFDNKQFQVSWNSLFLYMLIFSLCIVYAIFVYYIFERNTAKIQNYMQEILNRGSSLPIKGRAGQFEIPA
jgi:peptidoglycan/LPS O-acetylase OafA/YrhL